MSGSDAVTGYLRWLLKQWPRSYRRLEHVKGTYIDTELMLVIDSPELNHMLRENAALEMDMSRHVLPDGTQKYGADFQIVDVPLIRRISSGVLRIALVPFRHLL